MSTVEHFDDETWDCSCGVEDQPVEFWSLSATCSGCGAEFCFELEVVTGIGFFWTNPEEVSDD